MADRQMQVTIAAVYDAKPGKKTGTMKTTDGIYFDVWPDKIPLLRQYQGQTVPITYSTRDYNGKTYYSATGIVGVQAPQPAPPAPMPAPVPMAPPAPAPVAGNGASDKEEGMFVMGVVGRAMGSGQFTATDIDLLTKAAVEAWRNRHQRAVPQYRQPEPPPPGGPDDYGYQA